MHKPLKDLTGQRFGRLTALYYVGKSIWKCGCDCGGEAKCNSSNLLKGNSTSCGCKTAEARFKHGMSGTPQWHAWQMMRQRCENPKDAAYANYGGRGIRVCDKWHDFAAFVADMGIRPKGFELDRIDNDGNYEPGNCRWVSKKVNLNNKRTTRLVEWNGETRSVTAWAESLGVHPRTLANRLGRGWSIEKAMKKPVQHKG